MLIHALSLKGVGDQVAWVDFKGKEEIGVVGLFCKKPTYTLYHAIEVEKWIEQEKRAFKQDANI